MWDIERDGVALFLIKEGYSAREAGEFLGVTKNAMIGRVFRLGFTIKELQTGLKPNPRVKVKKSVIIPPKPIVMPILEPDPCTLTYLTANRCHWPLWGMAHDPADPKYYCGAPVQDKLYCLTHWRQRTAHYVKRSRRDPVKPFIIKKRPAKLPKSMVL